ncbi:MAG: acetyl/propionyl/methylcrotonyl-CoA carboxylase subunit alpha [Alphaproteobacteria bacterium]|nr:acetyl/propionyl/methylcrotonyl-CoA carboxylase subunit alpha [Alphaproteobacteria bacterium]
MFSKILIANRGEIACRIMRSCRRLGIKTVAVYSEADANGLHVREADEAILIGPAPSAQSYLRIDRIMEAVRKTGAEAVHPGFGFLSENAHFAAALKEAKVTFVGPDTHSVAAMGDKIESKKLAKQAGVASVPGYLGAIKDTDEAVKIAREIGYPVMIKASAGGGGKGMRIAFDDREAREGFVSASNEARSAFGDDRVFIEKFVEVPRHIEIQVLGDKHGNIVYLGERECSIQRRHQKVVEEAPSPFLDEATRKAMGEQAVRLAKEVKYHSAGTVEFIVDKNRNFYFLEMNTRLQVEHPVTELITGIDIVEWMIRVAAGEKLGFAQKDVKLKGWAMESRVYAEDPTRGFLPSIGRLARLRWPEDVPGVRIDTGVYEGAEISMYYDPMIAKLCTHGATRDEAIARMQQALDGVTIRGIAHNVPFLNSVMANDRFREGTISTAFIAQEYKDGFKADQIDEGGRLRLLAVACLLEGRKREREKGAKAGLGKRVVTVLGSLYSVEVMPLERGYVVAYDGYRIPVESGWRPGDLAFKGLVGGEPYTVQVQPAVEGWTLSHGGVVTRVTVRTERMAELAALMPIKRPPDTSKQLLSPMPGLVVSIAVKEGEDIQAGQVLVTIDAMKMENILRAVGDGRIKKIHAKAGDSLSVDQVIMEFA